MLDDRSSIAVGRLNANGLELESGPISPGPRGVFLGPAVLRPSEDLGGPADCVAFGVSLVAEPPDLDGRCVDDPQVIRVDGRIVLSVGPWRGERVPVFVDVFAAFVELGEVDASVWEVV